MYSPGGQAYTRIFRDQAVNERMGLIENNAVHKVFEIARSKINEQITLQYTISGNIW